MVRRREGAIRMAPVALPRVIPAILIPAAVIHAAPVHAVPPGKARVAPVALTHAVRRAKACVAIRTRRPAQVRVALATLTHAFPVGSTHAVPTAMARVAIRVVPLVRIHAATPAHAPVRAVMSHAARTMNPSASRKSWPALASRPVARLKTGFALRV